MSTPRRAAALALRNIVAGSGRERLSRRESECFRFAFTGGAAGRCHGGGDAVARRVSRRPARPGIPELGSERTGAPLVPICRIADKEIRLREPILEPDALIVQDPTLSG